ncbi:MAG: aminotransferase class I/II-fold pyridoxal phosphate-dependent enzyme, partial [Muribaculaceae bacterium]|nr:aminotransferase class I/II-fold pyridoxal phosphate-dependent enzyme [Muribaculaceae bacterium]
PTLIENDFIPALPSEVPDVIYLCYPNNPTGTALTRNQLKVWVDYARQHNTLIIFDAAYEAYISRPEVPHSIYEIQGAKEVAIEVRSYSKTAGFTGVRCGYTVVPKELQGICADGTILLLNNLWRRQQTTKFNGASYISQRGAAALYQPQAQQEIKSTIAYYMNNARKLRNALNDMGLKAVGGIDSPYVWVKTPCDMTSWQFFDYLLENANVVGTPGSGFGPSGEGYFRFTGFASSEDTDEAIARINQLDL